MGPHMGPIWGPMGAPKRRNSFFGALQKHPSSVKLRSASIACENLPLAVEGEAAFAASNTNISLVDHKAFIVTGGKKANVLVASEYGKNLEADFYCGSWLPTWREGKEYSQTVSANSDRGGGVLLELIHEIDLAHYLIGAPSNSTCSLTATVSAILLFTS